MSTLISMIGYLAYVVTILVIVQFVLSLLIAFNVVNTHNRFIDSLWQSLNALLEPILRPIRRILPDTGAIDFSPMALIVGLNLLMILLDGIERRLG